MSTLQQIILFTALSGVLSALAAAVFLALGEQWRAAVLPHLVSFATGTLLGAAFLGLIPHALESAGTGATHAIGLALLAGILLFFLLEKFVLWRHCHDDPCEAHSPDHAARDHASANLVLAGDTFHNLLDGVLVAAAFMTNPHLGIVTALAVFAHEIPQEVGDYIVLLNAGLSRLRALAYNAISGMAAVLGGVLGYFVVGQWHAAFPYLLVVAASSFVYVALADLMPQLQRRLPWRETVAQIAWIGAGLAIVVLLTTLRHTH